MKITSHFTQNKEPALVNLFLFYFILLGKIMLHTKNQLPWFPSGALFLGGCHCHCDFLVFRLKTWLEFDILFTELRQPKRSMKAN